MEIPEISSMIRDFEAGVNLLQNPSMVSRLIKQWGALIVVVVATFSSLMIRRRLKLRLRVVNNKPSAEPLLQIFSDEFDSDDDDTLSLSSSSEDDEEDDDEDPTTTSHQGDEDFTVKVAGGEFYRWQNGNLRLRRRQRFSWSDFSAGKSVVKLWDSLGLGFDDEDSGKSTVSMWEPAAAAAQSLILSANVGENGVVLGAYDGRMGHKKPAVYTKWGQRTAASDALKIRAEKVYVRNDVTGVLTVGDLRRLDAPLETASKSDSDAWWDADAVIAEDEAI